MALEINTDNEANVAYVSIRKIREGESTEQFAITDRGGSVLAVVDFSENGEFLGIELLNARVQLPDG